MSQKDSSVCVSVIVPAYNASATIGLTLEALSKQICFQPYEVIVVDDGSIDDTAQIVALFPSVKYLLQENAGPASARNYGARMAQGEYLAFTDSDCQPHKDWISLLMTGFSRPQVGVVSGSYGIANPQHWLARSIYKEIIWRHAHLMPDFPKSFGSYNFCVKRNIFDAVGGFNAAYRRASGEDNDLSYKIRQSGWQIFFSRDALVDHYHPTRVVKYLKEQYQHGFWRVMMYRDHPRMMRGDGYTYWKDILEMPWCACSVLGLMVCAWHPAAFNEVACLLLFGFLVFEVLCALMVTKSFFDGILYGFVLLFRAFARFMGFSTGILVFLPKKEKKIF